MNMKACFSMYKYKTTITLGIIVGWWLLHITMYKHGSSDASKQNYKSIDSHIYIIPLFITLLIITGLKVNIFVVMCHPNF